MMRKKLVLTFYLLFFGCLIEEMKAKTTTVSVKVGAVYNMKNAEEKVWLNCIKMSISDFYLFHPHYKTRLLLITRDSSNDVVTSASAALDLIKNEQVQAIIGPRTSMQTDFLINLGERAHVPIISYSATSPSLSSTRGSYFFRATQNDSTQVEAITAIIKFFGWKQAVPIYVDDEFGQGILPFLADALQEIDTRIPYRSTISPTATDDQIITELYKLKTMSTRVFIVHMSPTIGSRFFTKVKEAGMMSSGYVWIITNGMTRILGSLPPSIIDSMQGVLGVRSHIPTTKKLENFMVRWRTQFLQELDIYGLRAYDVATALAIAIEKAGTVNLGFQKENNVTKDSPTDLAILGKSRNGQNLAQALSNTKFKGLTGKFHLINRQILTLNFEVVNVVGNRTRIVVFWNGLVKKLGTGINTELPSSTFKSSLGVSWPGSSTYVPKGWQIPVEGKKLKIGVPVTVFSEFVKVKIDHDTNATNVSGYCIDIFEAVVKALPYDLNHEYIPFAKPDGSSAGDYNELIYQVYLGKYDAVVGDTTIIANRSLYVDFTLPYTESGVSMIVPIKDSKSKNAWTFLKPLTWDLWVTSFCFFVFIGFVVWVLEHRINEEFRGPPSYQASTSFWFSFSTLVFAQRERVVSNLARLVIIIWCFVVLILTQSYTASLTSRLTVQQLFPTVSDVKLLIKNGDCVGYQNGTFVYEILKRLGFDDSKIKAYDTPEECNQLLSNGSRNGGVAAVFDEGPYMNLFLANYCLKYTKIEPTFKTDGFGFVFPRGSPLVPDISRAILNVTEGEVMKEIERKWFGNISHCPDSSANISSGSLSLRSFWGLFLIAGIASISALVIFAAMFIFEHRQVLMEEGSIRSRIMKLIKMFDQKDLKSHTFKKSEVNNTVRISPWIFSDNFAQGQVQNLELVH